MAGVKFLKFTTDLTFKAFLIKSKKVCSNMLRDLVPDFKDQKVEVVEYLNTEMSTSADDEAKRSSLDIVARLDDDQHADIEMQCFPHSGLKVRMILYLCQLFISLIKKGTQAKDIKPVYLILFTRFTLFPTLKKICNAFGFRADDDNKVLFSNKLRIVTVELEKLDPSKPIEEFDKVEQWCYLIDKAHEATEQDMDKLAKRRPEMKQAVEHASSFSLETRQQIAAYAREKDRMIAIEIVDHARETGHEEGRQEGERQMQRRIARQMLNANKPVAEICDLTGLSEVELRKL